MCPDHCPVGDGWYYETLISPQHHPGGGSPSRPQGRPEHTQFPFALLCLINGMLIPIEPLRYGEAQVKDFLHHWNNIPIHVKVVLNLHIVSPIKQDDLRLLVGEI